METIIDCQKSKIETIFGLFDVIAFQMDNKKTHLSLSHGDISESVPLFRLQSHCLTSTAFGSTSCDCNYQIVESLKIIQNNIPSFMIYLDQEARGHGLFNKIKILNEYQKTNDLKMAQKLTGLIDDIRTYDFLPDMFNYLGIGKQVDLIGESKVKIKLLNSFGISVRRVINL